MGLDLLGGILRKLESTCLNECCSFPANPFRVCEDEGTFDGEDACAVQDEEPIINRRTRAKNPAALY